MVREDGESRRTFRRPSYLDWFEIYAPRGGRQCVLGRDWADVVSHTKRDLLGVRVWSPKEMTGVRENWLVFMVKEVKEVTSQCRGRTEGVCTQ